MKETTIYDSGVNVIGSIPDYGVMLDYISDVYGYTKESEGSFHFRTEKSLKRFIAAIESCILNFSGESHRKLFFGALADHSLTLQERLMVLFWQLTYANKLFNRITSEVFMCAVLAGRIIITAEEVLAFLRHIKEAETGELQWSEGTLKITASKYLTIMKKLGLATGTVKKTIVHPVITSALFVYFIRFVQQICPADKTLHNPYFIFSFTDEQALINRLKRIENTRYWNITQIGNELTIDLKSPLS